jgi:AraC-like DNA-binding protein
MPNRGSARRLFFRYAVNNVVILLLPLLVAVVYYSVSIVALRDGIDSFARAQLQQSIDIIDREFWELDKMVTQLGNDYEVNSYLSNTGRFSDLEFYNLRSLSEKLSPYVLGSSIVRNVLLYLHRSEMVVSDSGFGYFDDFYGTVISMDAYDARGWRTAFLSPMPRAQFIPSVRMGIYGNQSHVHLYRDNIGYGDYYLGSLIAIISADDLTGLLARTPQQYGGWVHVATAHGQQIATTNSEAFRALETALPTEGQRSVLVDGERLRLYRITSQVTGWQYTAALSETRVFSEVRLVRSIALTLLGVGLALGLTAAYVVAFRTSKPWRRVFEIVEQGPSTVPDTPVSAYDELESAIDVLANRSLRLQEEVGAAEQMTRHYFFQNVLRGAYRSRRDYERERTEFNIVLSAEKYYVVVARITPLNAARADEAYGHLREALTSSLESVRASKDIVIPISFDDVVLARGTDSTQDLHDDAAALVARVRKRIEPALRGDYCFGVGTAVADPFLLTISFNQALSAVAPLESHGHDLLRFYDELSNSSVFYSYPLDLEESLIRAVQGGNRDVVSNLLSSVRTENFEHRRLTDAEQDDLFVELKGTALKLYNALPGADVWPDDQFEKWWGMPTTTEKMDRFEELCIELSERFDGRKRSHNSALLAAIQNHIESHFDDPELSLTSIAETFKRSENYLSSFYKEQTGTRLSDELLKIRMEHARTLLADGFDAIDQVAERCGYASSASFRRAFKRLYGVSPSQFRDR